MKLCIAEKPSVAAEIAKVVGATTRRGGYFEGGDYCVTWVFGHLCELKEPHDYKPYWKTWSIYDLPILPDRFGIKLKEDSGVRRQFEVIKSLVAQAQEVINCGDAGQEGELIQRWVLQKAGTTCPVKRLWISSLTEEAIRDGFAHIRDSAEFDNLYAAGSARAIGDWLLGMNATRAYTLKFARNSQVLSIGRVQTPTLALIVERQNQIENFVPQTFWELKTRYRDVLFSAVDGKFDNEAKAQSALAKIEGSDFEVLDIQAKESAEAPPRLFDLTALQVECNKKFSFSAEETQQYIQSLYEKKLTTYPRVDTTYLSTDIYEKIPAIMRGLVPYAALTQPVLAAKIKKSKKVFDNSKVTDHHAIIPTGVPPSPSLPRNEKLVYDAIARRFIANFYPDSKVSTTTVTGQAAGTKFKCAGKQIVFDGWRKVYASRTIDDEQQDNAVLPDFAKGERGPHKPEVVQKQTQPPKPYTEATLLRAMETAGKNVEDEELREAMKDNGIGRPSTRAAIIETLYKRHYIEKRRKSLTPTQVGRHLVGLIKDPILKSAELTGRWEQKLRKIEKGEFAARDFLDEMRSMVTDAVEAVKNDNSGIRLSSDDDGAAGASAPKPKTPKPQCPRCGAELIKGRTAWGCSGYKNGCTFKVPFEVDGQKIGLRELNAMLKKGEAK